MIDDLNARVQVAAASAIRERIKAMDPSTQAEFSEAAVAAYSSLVGDEFSGIRSVERDPNDPTMLSVSLETRSPMLSVTFRAPANPFADAATTLQRHGYTFAFTDMPGLIAVSHPAFGESELTVGQMINLASRLGPVD